jgi:hypothetical protein
VTSWKGPSDEAPQRGRSDYEYDITAVPVVDDDGRPVGVVSEADRSGWCPRPTGSTSRRPSVSGAAHMVPVVVRLCESVDGVVDVVERLGFDRDDTVGGAAP